MSIYSGIPLDTLLTRLTAAQTALHELLINKRAVSVTQGDRQVRYSETQAPQLRLYIQELQSAIAAAQGQSGRQVVSVATWTR